MANELTKLTKLVTEINQFIAAGDTLWTQIANRLTLIKKDKLWSVEHKSFQAFVEHEWGRKRNWAYQLMRSHSVVEELTETECIPRDTVVSERAARELTKVPQEKRAKVVEVAAKNGPITAKAVVEAAKHVEKPAKVVVEDNMGTIIPDAVVPFWNRRREIWDLMSQVSQVKCDIEERRKQDDYLFTKISVNCVGKLELVYRELAACYPEVVCGTCEGRVPKAGCGTCGSTGFQSKMDYERLTPVGDRNIRKAAIAERQKNAATRLSTESPRLHP